MQQYDGTPKVATVTTNPAALTVLTITYNGSTTPPTAVANYSVVAALVNTNYTASNATGTLQIKKNTGKRITVQTTQATYTGSPIPVDVVINPAGLTYTVTYDGSPTPPTDSGSYLVIATITDPSYEDADTSIFVIDKATPVLTWPNPANISFGTPLSGTQLNATANVAGVFVYDPVIGTVLNVGTQNLSTTFTPTDTNYTVVNKIVPITVGGIAAVISISNLSQTYTGAPKTVVVTTSPAGLGIITVTYNGSVTPPTNAGSYSVVATLTNDNYTAPPATGVLTIAKAVPTITWATPANVKAGTVLSSAQLNATANVSGTFVYTPPAGTVLNAGTISLSVLFTPTDNTNYTTATKIVPLKVTGNPNVNYFIRNGRVVYENLPGQ